MGSWPLRSRILNELVPNRWDDLDL